MEQQPGFIYKNSGYFCSGQIKSYALLIASKKND
jgi:hypothetical protein